MTKLIRKSRSAIALSLIDQDVLHFCSTGIYNLFGEAMLTFVDIFFPDRLNMAFRLFKLAFGH